MQSLLIVLALRVSRRTPLRVIAQCHRANTGSHLRRESGRAIPRQEPRNAVEEPPSDRSSYADELLDRISAGELRVLRLLPTHLSATEIGSELCLSANTIKTHINRIYLKLGVHRRTDAVRRGRELRLIRASADQGQTRRPRMLRHRGRYPASPGRVPRRDRPVRARSRITRGCR